jgi:uncharacterized membrane protein YozB (DUF420 family)
VTEQQTATPTSASAATATAASTTPTPRPAIARPPAATKRRPTWLIPAGLIVLSLVPVIAGALRLTELASGPVVTEANARFVHSPIPVVIHIIGATTYLLLGALQFVPGLRRGRAGRRSWHKVAGRILVPAGLLAALSGMWMGVFYTRPVFDMTARLVFGGLMVTFLLLGLRAVLRRDFGAHRGWMIRAYAIGIGAGTQVFTALAWLLVTGGATPDANTTVLLLVAGWVINLSVAEVAIRRSVA